MEPIESAEETLQKVREVVRKRGNEIAGRLLMTDLKTGAIALLMIDEVAALIAGREMAREVAAGDYDLGALQVNLNASAPEIEGDEDDPFRDE